MKNVVFSALLAFAYTFFGSLAVAIYLLKKSGEKLDALVIVACVSLGIVQAIKDYRSSVRMSPLTNGSQDVLNRLVKLVSNQTKDENDDKNH